MPTNRRKPDVCTRYAVRYDGKYLGHIGDVVSLDRAVLYAERQFASDWVRRKGGVVVPVRCRALSAATKRSKKRTR